MASNSRVIYSLFIGLKDYNDKDIVVNREHIVCIVPEVAGCRIVMSNGDTFHVKETVGDMFRQCAKIVN